MVLGRLFGRTKKGSEAGSGPERLRDAVRARLGGEGEETVRIVAAIAGLLACAAYADKDYSEVEEARVVEELSRVRGLDRAGAAAIGAVLREHIVEITSAEASVYARELCDLCHRDLRLELLDVLVDVAAEDEVISVRETNLLRNATQALGLSQDDYNASQARHRDKLSVLRTGAAEGEKGD
ncbi:TerB family tellurite resistance protein [Polyangium aurulentum]|uniref:TerB family tellurite resistance protein n=1 Tax=Polyangium aurulentum TaxID=2567896 RepID=UPI0010ADEC29|nr:TerB family tellurite resistance protein [Polyangium aurulentum]UQA62759.1 TerB family tellurite resistance protein [Polyangium aurulentum]